MTFTTPVQIRFSDIDKLEHVNNACYLTYLEEARIDLFDTFSKNYDWKTPGLILANTQVDFVKPLFLEDDLHIKVWCAKIGNKSFELSYELYNSRNLDVLCSKAKTTLVFFNYDTNETVLIPNDWRAFLKNYQAK